RGNGSRGMSRRGRRGRTRRCARGAVASASLWRQALPAFAAAPAEDRATPPGAHPRPEAVGLGPLALLRLVGPLHWPSQYTDAGAGPARTISRHLRGGPNRARRPSLWSAGGARGRGSTEARSSLGRGPGAAARLGPRVHLPPLAGAAAGGRRAREDPLPGRAGGDQGLGLAPLLLADPRRPRRNRLRVRRRQLRGSRARRRKR